MQQPIAPIGLNKGVSLLPAIINQALPQHGKRNNMKKEDIKKTLKIVNTAYSEINDTISLEGMQMIDLAYPKHDGEQDADAVTDLMLLRQDANSLMHACEILVKKITDAIGDEEELSK